MFSTRKNTFSFKDGLLYRHNDINSRGKYYDSEHHPSFVDFIFNPKNIVSQANGNRVFKDSSVYLDSVQWNSDVSDIQEVTYPDKTISHLTVRTQYQHSGKIPLKFGNNLISDSNTRSAETKWHCNTFRDVVKNKTQQFIYDIFGNFDAIISNLNVNKAWFDKEQFNNRWFIVRTETDNAEDNKLVLHSVDVNKTDSYR